MASDSYPSTASHARPLSSHLPPIGELPDLENLPTDDDLDLTDSELLDIDANPGSYFLEPIHDADAAFDADFLDYSAGIQPPSPLGPRSPEIREVTPSLVQQQQPTHHHPLLPKPPGIPKLAEVGKAVLAAERQLERDIEARMIAEERRQEEEREREAYQGHVRAWLAAAPVSLRDFQLASSPPKTHTHVKKFSKGKRKEGATGSDGDGGDGGRVSFAAPGLSVGGGGGRKGVVRLTPTKGREPERKRRAIRGRAWREPSPELGMIEEVDEDSEVVMRDLYSHSHCEGLRITTGDPTGRADGFAEDIEDRHHDPMDVELEMELDVEDLPTPGLTTDTDAEGTPEPDELVEFLDRKRRPAGGPGGGKGKGTGKLRKKVRFAPWTEWMGCD
jgi:hypothetical protein